MAVSVGGDRTDPMVEPNVIPLVDIMLVLLIIFIITIPVMTHAVKIDLPRNVPNAPSEQPEFIDVAIDFDGSIIWNNSVIDRDTMLSYVAVDAAKDPQPEVHLRANPRVRYEYVADVLFAMQRGGLKKIGFLTGQGEAPPAE
ncbi:MAG TPA: biopolymer transporter ExbD [Steroidobacteraceae bacterium]|nr:biopolymer transporter ExbD [Steroidobacteraceae bacterium]